MKPLRRNKAGINSIEGHKHWIDATQHAFISQETDGGKTDFSGKTLIDIVLTLLFCFPGLEHFKFEHNKMR